MPARARLALIPLCGLLAAACAATAAPATRSPADIQVYAASSLRAVLAKAVEAYSAAHPSVAITVSADSSTALEAKIEQGAPADLFLAADTRNPQALVDRGLASGPVVRFAATQLTVIVPTANPAGIAAPADLARSGVKVIACAPGVPIEAYTAQWLAKAAALPGYGLDFAARVNANVVTREDNAAAIVTKVALGEGDAGVVYLTDARTSARVLAVPIPADQNVTATFGGVVVKGSANGAAAEAFLAWLTGLDGQAVLAAFGFQTASG